MNTVQMTHSTVHITFQRVQTWLFAVPRLRAMVGANALLGEVQRIHLPALARESGRGWTLAAITGEFPDADPSDPLMAEDAPAIDAQSGIASRDGGHFEAAFNEGAEAFAREAEKLLGSKLPGLRFNIRIDEKQSISPSTSLSVELPVLAPCEWTGRNLASTTIVQGADRPSVSLDVAQRHAAAKRGEDGKAHDLASLLTDRTILKKLRKPQELKDLADGGYLALIHADGNDVGSGARGSNTQRAAFFHRNRVLLRKALKATIDEHCTGMHKAPLALLMLGGDDVLIASRANLALPFVVSLCKHLDKLQQGQEGFKLTLGIGVIIAKPTIPFHRLHDIAERLAASAKRRSRGLPKDEPRRSVVDWAVYSTSWVGDPMNMRKRDWIRGSVDTPRVLSQRPVDVLGENLTNLEGLLAGAIHLVRAPRTQLRSLVEELPKGRALADLAFAELSKEAKAQLKKVGVTQVWTRSGDRGPATTNLVDLVEIAEIEHLGHRDSLSETGIPNGNVK